MIEQKSFRGKLLVLCGLEQFVRKMWEHFAMKKAWTRSVLVNVETERQDGTDGDWQQRSPYKEEVELVRQSSDLLFECLLMRYAYYAGEGRSSYWENYLEEFLKDVRLSLWASVKVRECYNEVDAEDEGRLRIAPDTLRKRTDFLEENHRAK